MQAGTNVREMPLSGKGTPFLPGVTARERRSYDERECGRLRSCAGSSSGTGPPTAGQLLFSHVRGCSPPPFGNGSLDVLRSGSSSSSSRAEALTRSLPGVNPSPSGLAPHPNDGVHGLGLPGIPVDAPPGEVDMEVFKSRPEVRSRIL